MLKKGTVVPNGITDNADNNHAYTWCIAYTIEGLRDWLFSQVKTPKSLERTKLYKTDGEVNFHSGSEIMDWVKENGKLISYASTDSSESSSQNNSEQLYDLAESVKN